MEGNPLATWTAVISELSASSIEKLSRKIDLGHPPDFFEFACHQWEQRKAGISEAWDLLMAGGIILLAVGHPSALTLKQAVTLTRFAMQVDVLFDTKLLRRLLANRIWPVDVPADEAMRTLEVLETLDDPHRLSMTLLKFAKFPNGRVQSKAAKILGRCLDSVALMEELYDNRDGRVRANLIEGLGRRESIDAYLPLIERATRDQNTRTSSIALALRARLGHSGAAALIKIRSSSKMDYFRKSAEFAQRAAAGDSSGHEANGCEIIAAADELLPQVDTLGVVEPQPAVAAAVHEVHNQPQTHPNEQPQPVIHSQAVH